MKTIERTLLLFLNGLIFIFCLSACSSGPFQPKKQTTDYENVTNSKSTDYEAHGNRVKASRERAFLVDKKII